MGYDVVIIGAGAAGLMCALEAGKRGRSVLVLERNETAGKKIRISGGGRCNFTNLHTTADHFISANANFHKSALARYTPEDFIRMVNECDAAGVPIQTNCSVRGIEKGAGFRVTTNGEELECKSLVIATGGLSIPKIGATDFGYRIARQFGLSISQTRPGLVPLVLEDKERRALGELSGVSLDATVRCGRTAFRENILFTHRGLSGPAVLQISSYWKTGETITIEPHTLPRRFVHKWRELYGPQPLESWTLVPSGTEGYAKAEVTAGGVDTAALSSKTMEARKVPGLYFIGEVVDVTGHLGGFNFQWAWASGWVAGQYV